MIGYNEALTARTARKTHRCAEAAGCIIRPGHRYIRFVAFPGHEAVSGSRPWVVKECIVHAARFVTDADMVAGACGSYCCALDPCARPARHDGEHSCRNCPKEVTP